MEHYSGDFDALAETYDGWYDTAEGAMYDNLEKQAVAEHISEKARGKTFLRLVREQDIGVSFSATWVILFPVLIFRPAW